MAQIIARKRFQVPLLRAFRNRCLSGLSGGLSDESELCEAVSATSISWVSATSFLIPTSPGSTVSTSSKTTAMRVHLR